MPGIQFKRALGYRTKCGSDISLYCKQRVVEPAYGGVSSYFWIGAEIWNETKEEGERH